MGITQNYSSTSGGRYFVGAVVNGRITSTSISYETSGSTMGSRQSCSSAGDGGNSGAVANDRTTSISMVQNLSAAELTGTLTQFECFPGLPAEIRVMIWKASMPGARVIDTPHLYINFLETKYPDSYRFVGPETPSSRKAPALLHACKESRIEALKTYKLLEITGIRLASRQHNFAAKFYIDYEKDTVFFNVLAAHLESPPIWRSGYPIPIVSHHSITRILRLCPSISEMFESGDTDFCSQIVTITDQLVISPFAQLYRKSSFMDIRRLK